MKKTLKILSVICAIVLIFGTMSVGLSAYAENSDIIGSYDYNITNVYKDINWNNVSVYKAETHVHTVRSDADTEVDDMIHKYYELGFDAMALTDHGTINYGWDHDQGRVAIFDYQAFVHGGIDNLSESDYKNIITGQRARSINSGKGMMEIPLGIELNGMSTTKCHVNGFYADADHGGLGITETWPRNAVKTYYNGGGFTHINHVGEWTDGNSNPEVYEISWVEDYVSIFEDYCPNRGGRGAAAQTAWVNSHKPYAGVIGMELVNTADSRTHNDRRMVYDESLERLAPQGINMFGFCEDDAHEYSDCDRNAQYILINKDKNVEIDSTKFDASNNNSGKTSDYQNDNNDYIDKVQNYYRDALYYGEFYASSKNSKNSYELGEGFNAVGAYPSVSNISVDDPKNQISVTFKDATKIRMIADGEVVESYRTGTGVNTVTFDLNRNESKINSYVRIYLTGPGGITYLQPFILEKIAAEKSTVQFITTSNDVNIEVKNADGTVIDSSWKYENYYYTLPAGEYKYTATRRGYEPKENVSFTVTQAQIDAHEQIKINVGELTELSNVSYAYFYTPETIYVNPSDNKTFEYYVDRENAIGGALRSQVQTAGNIFFTREGASNINLTYQVIEGATSIASMSIGSRSNPGSTLATSITAGQLTEALTNDQYVYIKWILTYTYKELPYEAISYTYIYCPKTDNKSVVGAGSIAKTNKVVGDWSHSTMNMVASIYVSGIHRLESTYSNSYLYSPYNNNNLVDMFDNQGSLSVSGGKGYYFKGYISDGSGSCHGTCNNSDVAYIYADRSRISNWSQIPYFMMGLDLNSGKECTGVGQGEGTNIMFARFGFDYSYAQLEESYSSSNHYLYDLEFSRKNIYTLRTNYNLDNPTDDRVAALKPLATDTISESFHDIRCGRLYQSDNEDPNRTFYKELPPRATQESVIPVSAYLKGAKEGRTDEISMEVNITLVNVDKSGLRTEFNDTVKGGFQADWFQFPEEWDQYQNTIAAAGKVLGNPASDPDQIEAAKQSLADAVDNFHIKTGTITIENHWRYDNGTEDDLTDDTEGLINQEPTYTFTYGEDITATAKTITGYTYDLEYDFYREGQFVYKYHDGWKYDKNGNQLEQGNPDYDLVFAEETSYKWVFYYTPNEYHATYNSNGAASVSYNVQPVFGQNYCVCTTVPEKTGYTFNNWYLDVKQKSYRPGENMTWDYAGDGEFTAFWKPNTYNITYVVGNEADAFSVGNAYKTATYGDTYNISPAIPTRTGYNFTGWALNGDTQEGHLRTPGSNIFYEIAGDSELTAQWAVADYTVTFDPVASGVTLDKNSITVRYGEPYGTLATASRTGYTYEWYNDPNYSNVSKVTATTNVGIAANHTLFAKWTPIEYTITYNLDGGSAPGNPTKYKVDSADITLIEPTKSGYSFIGWTGATVQGLKKNVVIRSGSTGDLTFNANWEISGYTIDYVLNGGVNDSRNPLTYKTTEAVTIYAATKTGYRFTGWKEQNSTQPAAVVIYIPINSTGNRTYIANWEIENYTIEYNYDAATETPSNPGTYNILSQDIELLEPKKDGFVFNGWDSNNNSLDGMSVKITTGSVTGNLTFKALWRDADAYKITYVLNGGRVEGVNPENYKTPSQGTTISIISPKRDGYTFAGWDKTVEGGSTVPQSNGSITWQDSGSITFTAKWTPITSGISYNLAGGRVVSDTQNPVEYTVERAPITLINPIRPGYSFEGWTGTGLTEATKTVVIPTGSFGERAYTATWKIKDYVINYEFNGGADTGLPKSYRTTTSNVTIGAPARPGYEFTGWNIDFESFDWAEGTINSSGQFVAQAGSYYSEPISLQSGKEYTIDSTVTGLKLCVFSSDGSSYTGTYTGAYTATADSIAFIAAENQQLADLRTVKLSISGTPLTYTIKSGSAGDMQFNANWDGEEYTINYNTASLTGSTFETNNPNPTTYTYDSSDILLSNPEKTGYEFTGWEYNGAVSKSTVIRNHSTGNRTYTATWEIANYAITYRGIDGATVDPENPATYTVNDTVTLSNPTKTGYTFVGWVGMGITEATKNLTIPAGSTGDRTYTATWSADQYAITYELNGGTADNPGSYTIEDEFTLTNPTRTGAVFTGWSGTDISAGSMRVSVAKGSTGARSYTASWTITDYTITYELNGGTENTNPTTYNVTSANITLAQPVKTGYIFDGWTGTGLDTKKEIVTIPTGSIGNRSYEASWKQDSYGITYNLDGGQVPTNANPTNYTIETATITLVNPTKAGYTFAGWTGTGCDTPTSTVTIPMGSTGNRSYKANWTETGFVITYSGIDYAGVTFEGVNKTFYTVVTNDFTLYNPSRPGYTFDGWSGTGISGSGISTSVTIPKGSSGNRSYKANWSLTTYTITYNLDGGTDGGLKNPETYTIFSAPITLYNPVKTGCDFIGWESDYYEGTSDAVTFNPALSQGNKTFTAVWGAGNYTITLDPNGGTLPSGQASSISYTYDTATFTIQNPTRNDGYNFAGWTGTGITSGSVMNLTIEKGSTGNRAYKATWVSGENVLTYDLDGGQVPTDANPSTYATGSGTITLVNPTKDGYKFNGWQFDSSKTFVTVNSVTKTAKINTAAGGSVDFKATWTPLSYKVSYNLNGGNVATANTTSYTIESTFTLNNPTREGYTFDGWSGTDLGENKYNSVTVTKETGNRTYTANWKEVDYKITYDYNGGSTHAANPVSYTVVTPSFTLNNPEKSGCIFKGWTGSNGTDPQTVVTVSSGSTGDKTYTANFEAIVYTITYEGLTTDTVFTKEHTTYTSGDPTFTIARPVRAGYIFNGWRSTDSLDPVKDVVIATGTTGNKEYTAQWTPEQYKIDYELNGGDILNGENPSSYTAESAKIVLLNPTKTGYDFLGWTDDDVENSEPNLTMIIAKGSKGDKAFTAVWSPEWFNITYYGLEGADAAFVKNLRDNYCRYNSEISLAIPNAAGAKVGYTFKGWTGSDLDKATESVEIPVGSSGDRSYTATWKINEYDLEVDFAGGIANREVPKSYTYESEKIVLPTPSREGYSFLGWSGTNIAENTYAATVEIPAHSEGNREYTAVWAERTGNTHKIYFHGYKDYPIILDPQTGRNYVEVTLGSPVPVVYDDNGRPTEIAGSNIQQTVGYQITGWDKDFNSTYYMNLNDDIHVYAQWDVGTGTYSVTVNSTSPNTKTCGQYELFTAKTDSYDSSGAQFCYWMIEGTGEVVSYYVNYSFYVHSDIALIAVYGTPSGPRVATRVSYVEGYDSNYDWFTVYTERNIATEYNLVQHGLIFTKDDTIGASTSNFVIGTTGVYNGVSSIGGLTGMWTLSIMNPHKLNVNKDKSVTIRTIYLRSYVKVADETGKVTTVYSPIKTYLNNEDQY